MFLIESRLFAFPLVLWLLQETLVFDIVKMIFSLLESELPQVYILSAC